MSETKWLPGPWEVHDVSDYDDEDIRFEVRPPAHKDLPEGWHPTPLAELTAYPQYAKAHAHLIAAAPALFEALEKAAAKFREYERLHLAKDTHDGRMKADTNADMAETCEAALNAARGEAS